MKTVQRITLVTIKIVIEKGNVTIGGDDDDALKLHRVYAGVDILGQDGAAIRVGE